ncbi:MAG: hypothetical protein ABJB85_11050 [Nitrososphaerota archaeon]
MLRIRDNATVKQINISKDKLEKYESLLRTHKIYDRNKKSAIKQYYGHSPCCICGDVPSVVVQYPTEGGGGTRIESYCQGCIKKVYEREQVL